MIKKYKKRSSISFVLAIFSCIGFALTKNPAVVTLIGCIVGLLMFICFGSYMQSKGYSKFVGFLLLLSPPGWLAMLILQDLRKDASD